ncbi:DNA adenine methylase [Candidatus Phytoplasma rubi]|uniref:DNA adenine methylase n=1 Tax=Candidatus Phytoplasma rubi TaxID=399025 RepID=UPI0022858040|nr:Dam family site-specific DNA-(adenine-N6)-methyltransferase [Candidatus Phytoplasma rubi]
MKINWIGCKKKLLPQIISHLPKQFKTYYEPFLGSGVLYFYLKPSKAILNDNDNQLIIMWQQSFQNPHHFVNKVKVIENYIFQYHNQKNQKQAYKNLLNQYNQNAKKRKKLTRSAIFYVLNKYAFRGITCYDKQNNLKTNFGYKPKQKTPIINLNELIIFQHHFQKKKHVLYCTDFPQIIANSQQGDFLFVDPPYYYEGIKDKDFYQKPFSFTDHQQLSLELHQAIKRGVKWLCTNYETTPILNLFPNYNII